MYINVVLHVEIIYILSIFYKLPSSILFFFQYPENFSFPREKTEDSPVPPSLLSQRQSPWQIPHVVLPLILRVLSGGSICLRLNYTQETHRVKFVSFIYAPEDQPFRASDTGERRENRIRRRRTVVGVCKVKMKEEISPRKNTLEDFQTQFVLYFNDNFFSGM
jgi:hypothetical protein